MKKLWILPSVLFVVLIASVLSGFFYQTELTEFFVDIGWGKLAGSTSGAWWSSAPSWVLAIIALFTFTIAIQQITQARKSTNAQVAVQLFQALRDDNIIKTLKRIYKLGPEWAPIFIERDSELKKGIEDVVDTLELLGALVAQGIFEEQIAIEAYSGSTVLRCWYVLQEYIIKTRNERSGLYCIYLEDFAARVWEYQKKKRRQHKDEWIKYHREEEEPINLIEEFEKHQELRPIRRR